MTVSNTSRLEIALMIDAGTLLAFVVAVLLLFLSPGPNMFFVLSHCIAHGSRGGLAAAFGVVAADILTVLTATGVTALIAALPALFDVLRVAGVLYLLWLAFQAIRSQGAAEAERWRGHLHARDFQASHAEQLTEPQGAVVFHAVPTAIRQCVSRVYLLATGNPRRGVDRDLTGVSLESWGVQWRDRAVVDAIPDSGTCAKLVSGGRHGAAGAALGAARASKLSVPHV